MNLQYRNVYSITNLGVHRGKYRTPTRKAASFIADRGRIGVETVCPYKNTITVVFYQKTP